MRKISLFGLIPGMRFIQWRADTIGCTLPSPPTQNTNLLLLHRWVKEFGNWFGGLSLVQRFQISCGKPCLMLCLHVGTFFQEKWPQIPCVNCAVSTLKPYNIVCFYVPGPLWFGSVVLVVINRTNSKSILLKPGYWNYNKRPTFSLMTRSTCSSVSSSTCSSVSSSTCGRYGSRDVRLPWNIGLQTLFLPLRISKGASMSCLRHQVCVIALTKARELKCLKLVGNLLTLPSWKSTWMEPAIQPTTTVG